MRIVYCTDAFLFARLHLQIALNQRFQSAGAYQYTLKNPTLVFRNRPRLFFFSTASEENSPNICSSDSSCLRVAYAK